MASPIHEKGILDDTTYVNRLPDSAYVVIDSITFSGNYHTRAMSIIREMNIKPGTLVLASALNEVLNRNQQLVYNTGLFNKVELAHRQVGNLIKIHIVVAERWYILPEFRFTPRDLSLFQWLKHPDWRRVDYSLGGTWKNITGRNDNLSLNYSYGYNRGFSFGYNLPFFLPRQKIGLSLGFGYASNEEVIYGSDSGNVKRLRIDNTAMQRNYGASIGLNHRITQNNSIYLLLGYRKLVVSDTVLELNSRYLTHKGNEDHYSTLGLGYIWDSRDVRAFPLHGVQFQTNLLLAGIDQASTAHFAKFDMKAFHYFKIGHDSRFYGAFGGGMLWLIGESVPYPDKLFLAQAGIRGFESYYVDGSFFIYHKSELKYELLKRKIVTVHRLPRQFRDFPVGIYPYAFWDFGMAADNTHTNLDKYYKNRLLSGYGFGVDFPYFYDNVFQLGYVFNNFGYSGLIISFAVSLR